MTLSNVIDFTAYRTARLEGKVTPKRVRRYTGNVIAFPGAHQGTERAA